MAKDNVVFQLVNQQEYLQHLDDIEQKNSTMTKSLFFEQPDQNAPLIEMLVPKKINAIKSPTNMKLAFEALDNADINIASFEVKYGWLDITDRIKKHAVINNNSVSASNVELPTGSHTITVQIKDSKGRATEKDFTFTVEQ